MYTWDWKSWDESLEEHYDVSQASYLAAKKIYDTFGRKYF